MSKSNPGSKSAIDAGCVCPVMDNSHGKGYYGQEGVYVYSGACEYHKGIIPPTKSTLDDHHDAPTSDHRPAAS